MKTPLRLLPELGLVLAFTSACRGDDDGTDEMTTVTTPEGGGDQGAPANAEAEDDEDDDAVDNVAACERLAESVSCGGIDLTATLGCEGYADIECDMVDYFDCLADTLSCVDGFPDPSGIAACVDMDTCE